MRVRCAIKRICWYPRSDESVVWKVVRGGGGGLLALTILISRQNRDKHVKQYVMEGGVLYIFS